MKVYGVYDSKAGAFNMPFYMQNAGMALRVFVQTAKDPNTSLNKFPSDFILFELGEFEERTGEFKNHDKQVNLGSAASHLSPAVVKEEK